jgi:hypothetical protein
MGRYANSHVRLDFPDLSEEGDLIYVTIRNPKTVPSQVLMPDEVPEGEDGKPLSSEAAIAASYAVMARIITDWHVYDGTAEEDSPPLPLPATVDHLKTLPFAILQRLSNEIGAVVTAPQ